MNKVDIKRRSLAHNQEVSALPALGFDDKDFVDQMGGVSGQCIRLNIRNGMALTIFDYHMDQPSAELISSPDGVELCVLFVGKGAMAVVAEDDKTKIIERIPYKSDHSYIILTHDNFWGINEIPAHCNFKGLNIRITPEFLTKLGKFPDFEALLKNKDLRFCSTHRHWSSIFPTNEKMSIIAKKVYDEALKKEPDDLQIELDLLQMLAVFSDVIQSSEITPTSKRDLKFVDEAIKLLKSDLSHQWTIDELARMLGLNKQKLKEVFRSEVKSPIYGYLQKMRMEKAHQLLKENGLSVTQTSLAVGYSNPSHFAYLFKRHYGVSPSKVR